jgi:hypothetical protein
MINQIHLTNQIELSRFGCTYCGKNYKTRTNLHKHQVLCETLTRAKKQKSNNDEEILPIPSIKQMYKIILDLSLKCNHLEEKVEEMQKWVIQKRKKINILEWLNENHRPSTNLESWIQTIKILKEETELIFQNSFLDVLREIGNRIFYQTQVAEEQTQVAEEQTQVVSDQKELVPIFAFTQKPNTLYIFQDNQWCECSKQQITKILINIHFKYTKSFIEWKRQNDDKINSSDSSCEICNKANIKLMGVQFKHEQTYHRGKSIIYNKLKTDIKSLIEYEFEF